LEGIEDGTPVLGQGRKERREKSYKSRSSFEEWRFLDKR